METITIPNGMKAKLDVAISSDANVATNVSLNDTIIKKSAQYKFSMEFDPTAPTDAINTTLSIVSSFFVSTGNLDQIMNVTQATHTITFNNESHELVLEKLKITNTFFIIYSHTKIIKS